MAVKQLIKFIRRRGRIIPIRFHQTSAKNIKSIMKSGFKLKKPVHGVDKLPSGIFTKRSPRKISLQRGFDKQLMVIDKTKKTKVFKDRESFGKYILNKSPKISKLKKEAKMIDDSMVKTIDRLTDKIRVQRKAISKATGSMQKARLTRGKSDRLLHRWRKLIDQRYRKIGLESKRVLKSDGYDSLEILKDQGGFGKVTDTKITFNPSDVVPVKFKKIAPKLKKTRAMRANELLDRIQTRERRLLKDIRSSKDIKEKKSLFSKLSRSQKISKDIFKITIGK